MLRTPKLLLCLLLALSLGWAGCDAEDTFGYWFFAFLTPTGALFEPGPDVAFELVVLAPHLGGEVTILLDGTPLDPSTYTVVGRRASGTALGLAPGPHQLRAQQALVFGAFNAPFEVYASFVVAAPPSFDVRESVAQLHVTHADPGTDLVLYDGDGVEVADGEADYQGSLVLRELAAGTDYWLVAEGTPTEMAGPLTVLDADESLPPPEFYSDQVLEPGFTYITTRDGTKLSAFVSLPGPPEDGPYPTLVNYSGYDPSEPGKMVSIGGLDPTFLCISGLPILCNAPNHPSGLIAGVMGYATVGVNVRGTGCSGGAYDFFETLQVLDGYDAIEVVAAQPWVQGNKVGMAGLSYPGITQLFVAAAQPPSLAAITPLSVISSTQTILGPGGILNNGFALEWGQQVLDQADPYGRGWEQGVVDDGDTVCEENQLLHSQKVDIIEKARSFPFYEPEVYDPLDPSKFVDRIQVPVFTSGQWQDEQTGGHFPDLWDRFVGSPVVRFTGLNGAHADGYTPQVLIEWKTFLDFYVAQRVEDVPPAIRALSGLLFQEIFGSPVEIPPHRFLSYGSFEEALAAYEAEDPVRIIVDSGGAPTGPVGAPIGGFELTFDQWPPPETTPLRLFLEPDGSLADTAPVVADSSSGYDYDGAKGQETYDVHGSFEKTLPDIQWLPEQPGRQVVFATAPLADDLMLVGHASADLWVQATADDVDLEVTLSEIRPDGKETYISNGWLRASQRALSPLSTTLEPIQTHLESDAAPLPAGVWEPVRIEIYPFAHALRAGSQLRLAVSTPGGNKGRWKFEDIEYDDPVRVGVAHSADHPSSLVLPMIPGVVIPTPLPACPALRSQPCRDHQPQVNASFP